MREAGDVRESSDSFYRRRFGGDDDAVNEVLGFILSFALSAVFLMLALTSFWQARDNTDSVVAAAELKTIADRVSTRIVEAGLVAQAYPNATINLTVRLPQQINGHNYQVEAALGGVWVNATDAPFTANATIFKLDAVSGVAVSGLVVSSYEHLVVTYSIQNPSAPTPTRDIHIHG